MKLTMNTSLMIHCKVMCSYSSCQDNLLCSLLLRKFKVPCIYTDLIRQTLLTSINQVNQWRTDPCYSSLILNIATGTPEMNGSERMCGMMHLATLNSPWCHQVHQKQSMYGDRFIISYWPDLMSAAILIHYSENELATLRLDLNCWVKEMIG